MKSFFLFLLFLSLIGSAEATTYIPFSNSSENINKYSVFDDSPADSQYILNSSDSFLETRIVSAMSVYPQTQLFTFKDVSGNIINIQYIITANSTWYLMTDYTISESVAINGVMQKLYFDLNDDESAGYSYSFVDSDLTLSGQKDIKYVQYWNGDHLKLKNSNALQTMFIYVKFPNSIYPSQIDIPQGNWENMQFYTHYLETFFKRQNDDIDAAYAELNFVLKFVFQVGKAILAVVSVLGIVTGDYISDQDWLDWQANMLIPLQIIDSILSFFLRVISFLMVMGITFTFIFVECVIFIFCHLKTRGRSLVDTIHLWASNSMNFWDRILIRPLIWIFEKLVKIWS